jgi:hypothetical protein
VMFCTFPCFFGGITREHNIYYNDESVADLTPRQGGRTCTCGEEARARGVRRPGLLDRNLRRREGGQGGQADRGGEGS